MHVPGRRITSGTLYRRIYPHPAYYSNGVVTSQVFDLRKEHDHLSMAVSSLCTPQDLLVGHENFGVLEIDVADLVTEGLEVQFDPSESEGPAHVAVRGNLTRSVRKRLASRARVIIPPTTNHKSGPALS